MASRSGRTAGIILTVLGLLCLIAAAILTWVVVPQAARVPADKATTRQYTGKANIVLNAQALEAGDTAAALIVNTPITAERKAEVQATDGDAAKVHDSRVLNGPGGRTLGTSSITYAIDRTSLEQASSHPSSWNVTPHQGLTVSFPIPTNKHDYTGWINETRKTTPLKYSGTEQREGITTYVFKADSTPEQITDPGTLAQMPRELPVSALSGLSSVLPLSDADRARLAQALPSLTQPVQLTYTYQVTSKYWIEPTTGMVINNDRHEVRKAGLRLPNGQTFAAVIPVFDISLQFSSASQSDAASEAKDDKNKINLWSFTVPLILLIVGAILVIIGIVLLVLAGRGRGRRVGPGSPATAGPPGL